MIEDRTFDARTEYFSDAEGVDDDQVRPISPHACDLDNEIYQALFDAAMSPDQSACRTVIAKAIARGIDEATLADTYVPAVSRQMGDMWCADTMGFAEVTIGVARLQALLRDLGPEWHADQEADAHAPSVLLITTRDAQHTLGSVILAGQLRRRGFSVRMALDATYDKLAHLRSKMRFDAIFISASQSESLEKIRQMIEFLRETSSMPMPIAVGGGILGVYDNIAPIVGAGIATSNIDEAIEYCGLLQTHSMCTTNEPKA